MARGNNLIRCSSIFPLSTHTFDCSVNFTGRPSNDSWYQDCYESIQRSSAIMICALMISIYITLYALKELLQMYQQRLHYILEIENLISWVLYISTLIMIIPTLKADGGITNVHYSAASISVFLSWFSLLLLLQRFDQVSFTTSS